MAKGKRGPRPAVVGAPFDEPTAEDVAEALATPVEDAEQGEDGGELPEAAPEQKPEPEDTGQRTERGERIVALPVRCRLTAEERLRKGEAYRSAQLEVRRLEAEKSDSMRSYNGMLKDARAAAEKLGEQFDTAHEERVTSCIERPDYQAGMMRLYRVDDPDGPHVDERAMTPAERQMNLPLEVLANPDTAPVAHVVGAAA